MRGGRSGGAVAAAAVCLAAVGCARPLTPGDGPQSIWGAAPDDIWAAGDDVALAGAWTEMRDLEMNPATAIPGKYKSLIGLAVSAQIPCKFCIIADTEFAKLEGATERELSEAVAMSGLVRHWNTVVNGRQADKAAFKKDINRLVAGARKHMAAAQMSAGKPSSTMAATKQ